MWYNNPKRFIKEHNARHIAEFANKNNIEHNEVHIKNIKIENHNRKHVLRLCHLKRFIRDSPTNAIKNTTNTLWLCHLKKFIRDRQNKTMNDLNWNKNTQNKLTCTSRIQRTKKRSKTVSSTKKTKIGLSPIEIFETTIHDTPKHTCSICQLLCFMKDIRPMKQKEKNNYYNLM